MKNVLKDKVNISLILIGYLFLVTMLPSAAHAQYTLDEEVSFIYINGTSTMHDWTASANQMKGALQANVEDNQIVKISSLSMTIPATSLKSGKEAMDKNMYRALKTDQYPEIVYQLKSHTIHNEAITTIGELTIAGVAKNIETEATQKEAGKHIKIDGEVKLKMSDFNIKPPEFLLGAFKTGDEITIIFHFMFCKKTDLFTDD